MSAASAGETDHSLSLCEDTLLTLPSPLHPHHTALLTLPGLSSTLSPGATSPTPDSKHCHCSCVCQRQIMQPLSAWHKGHMATRKPEALPGKAKTQVPHAAAINITGLMLPHPITEGCGGVSHSHQPLSPGWPYFWSLILFKSYVYVQCACLYMVYVCMMFVCGIYEVFM